MGIPVMILGQSGSGKSASLRNFKEDEVGVVNVLGKPFPFRNKLKTLITTDYQEIIKTVYACKAKSIVIDDAGYLITDQFMKGHSQGGSGNAVFALYNDIGDCFYNFIQFIIRRMPDDKIVYLLMHEEKNDFGDIKPKTIGKLLDEKVCLEGMFTIVLRAYGDGEKHIFLTASNGLDVCKTPIGMFDNREIENDLKAVDDRIREYYEIKINKGEQKK
ncbi:AAA family ATPase [Christensenella hongkongensis]|uniref:Phage protein n=1 Tax=Christensenella hongkongensis TaxID=270498 RepID=A0A0M2NNJ8_9FIRM|nr:AAA family ATPase [Christensenella hongkongensis]KKI51790.1 Phage protein [Christensenella hongkongensis]TCW30382.1 AAA domain-containing protein [Christensenella hongkongensis]